MTLVFVLLRGTLDILGKRIAEHSVVFCPAHELHGIFNPADEPAYYLVIEFHPGPKSKYIRNFFQLQRLVRGESEQKGKRMARHLRAKLLKRIPGVG